MSLTREFLKKLIEGISDENITSIINESQKDAQKAQSDLQAKIQELQTVTTERDALKTQIGQRDDDIKALQKQVKGNEDLETQVKTLQDKYNADTKALTDKLSAQAREFASEKFFSGVKFSSELAKKAALADFAKENFQLDEKTGNFIGGNEWLEKLKKDQPTAFEMEKTEGSTESEAQGETKPASPFFSNPNGSQQQNSGVKNDNPFNFNFNGVREQKK